MKRTFNIEVMMEERWIDYFCSMLRYMEHCGDIGRSATLAFYSDGDGDFRPKFKIDTGYEYVSTSSAPNINVESFYDAG